MMLAFLQSLETLIHVGFVATALAFLVRDILWLRLLATLSYSLFCIVAVTMADGPVWHLVLWYLTFITINLGHAAYLLYERTLVKLTAAERSEEHTSELQSLMRISYAVFCLKKKTR